MSGLIFVDPSTLRRSTAAASTNQDTATTMSTTACQLARAFGIVVRQIADLLTMLQDYHALAPNLPRVLDIPYQEALDIQVGEVGASCHTNLIDFTLPQIVGLAKLDTAMMLMFKLYLEYRLKPTWDWLITVLDSTEAQLRFGSSLSEATDPSHPTHPMHATYLRSQRERTTREDPRLQPAATPTDTRRRSGFGAVDRKVMYCLAAVISVVRQC